MRAALFLALLPVPCIAQDFVSPRIGAFEAGIACDGTVVEIVDAPGTAAGTVSVLDDAPPFVSNSRTVPAVMGLAFGTVAATNDIVGLSGVTMRVSHPPFPGIDGTEDVFTSYVGAKGDPLANLFRFELDYELQPGDWSMEAWDGDDLLYRVEFTVVTPAELPELAAICGYEHLLG